MPFFSETNSHSRQPWQNLDVEEDTKLDKVELCRGLDSMSSKHKSPVTKDNGTLALTPETGVQSCEPLEEHRGRDKGTSTREHKQG